MIKLTLCDQISCNPQGQLLLDEHSIESVEGYQGNGYVKQSTRIVMKAVITGFHGDNDEIIQYQTEHYVLESVDEIESLLRQASADT